MPASPKWQARRSPASSETAGGHQLRWDGACWVPALRRGWQPAQPAPFQWSLGLRGFGV